MIHRLKEMLEIQGQEGNYNYAPYHHGFYNGLEFAIAVMEGRQPNYRKVDSYQINSQEG